MLDRRVGLLDRNLRNFVYHRVSGYSVGGALAKIRFSSSSELLVDQVNSNKQKYILFQLTILCLVALGLHKQVFT